MDQAQEQYVLNNRRILSAMMAHTKDVFEPLYLKLERKRGARELWTPEEREQAERTSQMMAGEAQKIGSDLYDTPGLDKLTPSVVGAVEGTAQMLFAAFQHLKDWTFELAERGAAEHRLPPEEFFVFGPWRAHLRTRTELAEHEQPIGFEFGRAALLRAQKRLFAATSEVKIKNLKLNAGSVDAYQYDIVNEAAVKQFNELIADHPELKLGPAWKKRELERHQGMFRHGVDAVARTIAHETASFVEIIGPDKTVLGTHSPSSAVIEHVLQVTRKRARRTNPPDDLQVLLDWISWVEG